ncbi:MAG: hypothetical protein ACYCZX_20140, partial [Rhodospirillaceae bacterium]
MSFLDPQHLSAYFVVAARMCAWLVVLSAVFLPLEHFFAVRRQKIFHRGLGTDLGYYAINSLVPGLLLAVPLSLAAWGG